MPRIGIASNGWRALELVEREVTPILSRVLMLPQGNDHHPDVVWLYNWLAQPERTPTDFLFVVVDLREELQHTIELWVYENNQAAMNLLGKYAWPLPTGRYQSLPIDRRQLAKLLSHIGKHGHFYVIKAAAEALAARCSVMVGTSVKAASLPCLKLLGPNFVPLDMFSNWIIQVLGDPCLCPDIPMRFKMLQLYTNQQVKIDDANRKQALESLMIACASLPSEHSIYIISARDLIGCLSLFDEDGYGDGYLSQYDLKVANKLRNHRKVLLCDVSQKYSMGLKVNVPPSELSGLISILRYISNKARQDYRDFQQYYDLLSVGANNISLSSLLFIYRNFRTSIMDPLVLHVIIDTIIVVMESLIMVLWKVSQEETFQIHTDSLFYIDEMLENLCETPEDVEYDYPDETFIGKEVMKRYKGTFLKIRAHVDKDFLEGLTFMHNMLHEEVNQNN